jgi:hypothetical protein
MDKETRQRRGRAKPGLTHRADAAALRYWLLSGLVVALGGAFGVEYFNRTVKSERDVERYLGLPCSGPWRFGSELRRQGSGEQDLRSAEEAEQNALSLG